MDSPTLITDVKRAAELATSCSIRMETHLRLSRTIPFSADVFQDLVEAASLLIHAHHEIARELDTRATRLVDLNPPGNGTALRRAVQAVGESLPPSPAASGVRR